MGATLLVTGILRGQNYAVRGAGLRGDKIDGGVFGDGASPLDVQRGFGSSLQSGMPGLTPLTKIFDRISGWERGI